jgi:hypothetical protein
MQAMGAQMAAIELQRRLFEAREAQSAAQLMHMRAELAKMQTITHEKKFDDRYRGHDIVPRAYREDSDSDGAFFPRPMEARRPAPPPPPPYERRERDFEGPRFEPRFDTRFEARMESPPTPELHAFDDEYFRDEDLRDRARGPPRMMKPKRDGRSRRVKREGESARSRMSKSERHSGRREAERRSGDYHRESPHVSRDERRGSKRDKESTCSVVTPIDGSRAWIGISRREFATNLNIVEMPDELMGKSVILEAPAGKKSIGLHEVSAPVEIRASFSEEEDDDEEDELSPKPTSITVEMLDGAAEEDEKEVVIETMVFDFDSYLRGDYPSGEDEFEAGIEQKHAVEEVSCGEEDVKDGDLEDDSNITKESRRIACFEWNTFGACFNGAECPNSHFIHCTDFKKRVTNYKVKPCVEPALGMHCSYGDLCNFVHPGEPLRRPMPCEYVDKQYYTLLLRDLPMLQYPFGVYM